MNRSVLIMRSAFVALGLGTCMGFPGYAVAQEAVSTPTENSSIGYVATAPQLTAVRAVQALDIDGRLDDPAWLTASVAGEFVQYQPSPGDPATEQTEVRVLYTDEAIFVGARMHDRTPDGIIRRLNRRDERGTTDVFFVAVDSYFDRRTAFAFEVSVAGVQRDWVFFSDTQEDVDWNAVWESAVQTDEAGWTAEIRIPLSQLRFAEIPSGGEGAIWGLNFGRHIARLGEWDTWAPIPEDGSRLVSAFGTLRNITGIRPLKRVEARPYALASAVRAPGSARDPFYAPTDYRHAMGLDLKYGLTNNITLDVTVNPDFGQVEADPAVVNLTAFETFFPEKRPFFQEGADIFQFRIGGGDDNNENLFYSRRIGRRPQGYLQAPHEYADVPDQSRILGAAKVSGKTSDGWSIGFLDAVTRGETGRFVAASGVPGEQRVEPLTNYATGRVIRDFRGGESALGFIGTATNRSIDADGPLTHLPGSAYAGGFDFRHRFGGGNYQVRGHVLGSHVQGDPVAIERLQRMPSRYFQRPDADHTRLDPARTSLSGTAASLTFQKLGGGHWRYGLFADARSPGFEVNDLGFFRDADMALGAAWLGYQQFRPQGPFRRWGANANTWSGWNFAGDRLFRGGNVNANFQLNNFWGGYGGFGLEGSGLSPTALRGGPALYYPDSYNGWMGMFSDQRLPIQVGINANFGGEYGTGSNNFSIGPRLSLQPSTQLQLSLQPRVSWNNRASQYVSQFTANGEPHYIFGRLSQRTVSLTTRMNYVLDSKLSVQVYLQPFVSAGEYDRLMEVSDPRAAVFDKRFREFGDDELTLLEAGEFSAWEVDLDADGTRDGLFANPDFNVKSLRSNVVLRWEYRPGSAVFVVWSRDQSSFANDGRFDFRQDLGDVFGLTSTNVFLVKLQYWLPI